MFEPLPEAFLLERGYCCGSGCKNCPYDPKHNRGNVRVRKEVEERIKNNQKKGQFRY